MKKGSALVLLVIILGIFSSLSLFLIKIVYNSHESAGLLLAREQAFFLAEAGLEKGKVEITHNPEWYTDLPYYLSDNVEWLTGYAQGEQNKLGDGHFKIIREKGKNTLYSAGFRGKGRVVLKIAFSVDPFNTLTWEEL